MDYESYCIGPLKRLHVNPPTKIIPASEHKQHIVKKIKKMAGIKKEKQLTKEEIYAGFQQLRVEQRNLASKLSELEQDLNEHKIVLETLKGVNEDRKCYRMIGGVLCERTVKDVIPILTENKGKLSQVIESMNEKMTQKGVELNEYKEKYNIQLHGRGDTAGKKEEEPEEGKARGNVLVVDSSHGEFKCSK